MPKDRQKCLGEDVLSLAFFLSFQDPIHHSQLAAFQHIFSSGRMPESLSAVLICLFPKGGDRQEIRQWCPITLFSTTYKAVAKMISSRV